MAFENYSIGLGAMKPEVQEIVTVTQLPRLQWAYRGLLLLLVLEYLGLSASLPALRAIRFSTVLAFGIVSLTFLADGLRALGDRRIRLLAAFTVLSAASVLWAVVGERAFGAIRPLVDYLVLAITVAVVVDRPSRLTGTAATLAIIVLGLVGWNVEKLVEGSRTGAFRAGYFLGDGNDFAWGLNVLGPLALILFVASRRIVPRAVGLSAFAAAALGTVWTQSRGGTLGLVAGLLWGWCFVARRRVLAAAAVLLLALVVFAAAPGEYLARMETITEYEADNSAQYRLQAWGAAVRMAFDYPLGVGAANFPSAYGRFYIPDAGSNRVVYRSQRWASAHSIYFVVLGEYGFPGLAMLLVLVVSCLRANTCSRRNLRGAVQPALDERVPALLNMALVSYAVSGAFLGGFSYPHLFLLSGLTVAVMKIAERETGTGALVPGERPQ
jgi:probable O-glycosylation ligase (exosortase A-associated)